MKKVFDRAELEDDIPILEPPEMDKCIVGLQDNRLTYSYMKLLEYFQTTGMTEGESEDWIAYNVIGLNLVNIQYPDV